MQMRDRIVSTSKILNNLYYSHGNGLITIFSYKIYPCIISPLYSSDFSSYKA